MPVGKSRSIELPAPRFDGSVSIEKCLRERRSVRAFKRKRSTLSVVSQLVWAAQGVTEPMDAPAGWSWGPWQGGKRTAPSAGATYPLELFVVVGDAEGMTPGVYQYRPLEHRLEEVASGDRRAALASAASGQEWIAQAPVVFVVGAVPERTEMKYGTRSARYIHVEAGHAVMNICLQAVALGLGSTVVGAFQDESVKKLMGMSKDVIPLLVVPVGTPAEE